MAKKPSNSALSIPILPQFETRARRPLFDGLWPGIDGSMWLWRSVPMGSVPDARTADGAVAVGHGLANAYEALAAFAGSGAHRSQVKSTYRDTHALLLNVPTTFTANPKSPIADELNREYGDRPTIQRVLLFGVRLKATTGNGTLKSAVDSVWETIRYGGSPLSDYEKDHRDMAMVFSRAGFSVPSLHDLHLADSWWNYGLAKGVPVLLHDEHVHFFHSAAEARAAVDINRLDCGDWPEAIGEHAISFAAVESFDLDFTPATDSKARWVIPLLDSGARVISIRAKVEPSKVTRNELRGQQRRYRADLNELQAQGKMDRAELEEREGQLTSIERAYANGGPATLMDTSVIIGFSGVIDDIDKFSPPGVELSPMLNRQGTAWHETMANSAVRANPLQHDLPQTTISYSALPTLTRIGDADGALLGMTEDDRQPAYLSPVAAADEDTLPFLYVLAATRAGKDLALDCKIPTPTGWTTMGELRVGDEVLGRDGRPCCVTFLSEINTRPDLYRVTLSDGQTVDAGRDHQWVVSNFQDRNGHRKADHRSAIVRWHRLQACVGALAELALNWSDAHELTVKELFDAVQHIPGIPWSTEGSVASALALIDAPYRIDATEGGQATVRAFSKRDAVRVYDVRAALDTALKAWLNLSPAAASRWEDVAAVRATAAAGVLERSVEGATATAPEMQRMLVEQGAPMPERSLFALLRQLDVPSKLQTSDVQMPGHVTRPRRASRKLYPARETFAALAARVSVTAGPEPTEDYAERILTTGEMRAEGLENPTGAKQWAIHVPAPLELPDTDLLVPPYTFGAWLGDGCAHSGNVCGMDPEVFDGIQEDGYKLRRVESDSRGSRAKVYFFEGLRKDLGVIMDRVPGRKRKLDKRIPVAYLRASHTQRLALLQGLMDTDGAVSMSGACEISLSKRDLAEDVLGLVRSFGIKAYWTEGESAYRLDDGTRKVTGTRHRIRFMTTLPVTRLPRKAERLPAELAESQQWLYVESIERIDPVPTRCIQVDSPDSTYLAGQFVPTHNTMLLQNIAHQFNRLLHPQVIIDFKKNSDLSDMVRYSGGQTISLDDMVSADGPLDPVRIFPDRADAIAKATSMIHRVNPYHDSRVDAYANDISFAISWGIENGAKATGQALMMAAKAGLIEQKIIDPIFKHAQVYPMFRATFGIEPHTQALNLSDGLTLVRSGATQVELPPMGMDPSDLPRAEPAVRNSLNVIRMLVWGSLASLSSRRGVLHFDESWMLEKASPSDLDEVGRLCGQWGVFPIFYNQRPSGPLKIGLKGYISRFLIGHIKDEEEAAAALQLANIDNPRALERITAERYHGDGGGLNWDSLQHLPDGNGGVARGSVFYYADLRNRLATIEHRPSDEFLRLGDQSPEGISRRQREKEESLLALR